MRLVYWACGQDTKWQDPQVFWVEESNAEQAAVCATMTGKQFSINTAVRTEYVWRRFYPRGAHIIFVFALNDPLRRFPGYRLLF